MRNAPLLLLAVVMLAACEGEGASSVAPGADSVAAPDQSQSPDIPVAGDLPVLPRDLPDLPLPPPDTAAPDLAGTDTGPPFAGPSLEGVWAQRRFHASFTVVWALGEQPTSTTSLSLVTVEQEGARLALASKTCALEIDNGTDLVNVLAPNALIESLGVDHSPATLEARDGAWRYVQPTHYQLRGYTADDPAGEPLPADAADPRVWDQDGDGNPGITMVVQGVVNGLLYLAQRASYALDGAVLDDDQIEGLAVWSDEQVILGTDDPGNPALASDRPKRPGAPEDSVFQMVRLPAGGDCATVLRDRTSLFSE